MSTKCTQEISEIGRPGVAYTRSRDRFHRLSKACHLNSPPMTTYDKIVTSSLLSQPESLVTFSADWQRRDVTTRDIKCIAVRAEALQLTSQDGFLHAVKIDK